MSVVINNFNLFDAALRPFKAKTPLVIDTNAMLTFSVFLQGFKFVLWRNFQVIQITYPIEHGQLAQRHGFNVDPALDPQAIKQLLGISTLEAENHLDIVTSSISNVKRYLQLDTQIYTCANPSSVFKV